jgi:hypothetical protein
VTRDALVEQLMKRLHGRGCAESAADFILENFTEKPKLKAEDRLARLLWDDVRGVDEGIGQASLIAEDLLRNHLKELLDVCEQRSREALLESIARNGRGFGV